MRLPAWLASHLAALRTLIFMTALFGVIYPLVMVGIARIPGLSERADGSFVSRNGQRVGSSLIGQLFTDAAGVALPQYFQSRPSAAGKGYDPTSTSASNLGPENVVDTLADPAVPGSGKPSLLTQICQRSLAIGQLDGVDGRRPFCTPDGVGAVLAVFHRDGLTGPATRVISLDQPCPSTPFLTTFQGIAVECARFGENYTRGVVTPIHGDAPAHPAVPPDAVTASGSGLDPHISPAYANLQAPRVARQRGVDTATINALVLRHTRGRLLGFIGESGVNVVELNLELDQRFPIRG
jgi:K+-transporting ATPase ATPase C chain